MAAKNGNELLKRAAAVEKTTVARVRFVESLMAAGEYIPTAAFRRELADVWGISESTFKNYSAEAHRNIAIAPEARDAMRNTIAARLLDLYEQARTTPNRVTGLPDIRAARECLVDMARFVGVNPPDPSGEGADEPVEIHIIRSEKKAT